MGQLASPPIIADRAEFIEALNHMRRGHVLVRTGEGACGCVLDGAFVHHSFGTLVRYGLIDEYDNPDGFPGLQYFRITDAGRHFADRAWAAWRKAPPLARAMVRLVG